MSGPQKAVRLVQDSTAHIAMSDGRVIKRRVSSEWTPPAEGTKSATASKAGGGLAVAKKAVTDSIFSLNLFLQTKMVDDPYEVKIQIIKTRIYLPLFILVVFGVAISYLTTKSWSRLQAVNPSYAAYLSIVDRDPSPSCTCTGAPAMQPPIVTTNIPPYANFSTNLCQLPEALKDECFATGGCGANAALSFLNGVNAPFTTICLLMKKAFALSNYQFSVTALGPAFIPNAAILQAAAASNFGAQARSMDDTISPFLTSQQLAINMFPAFRFEWTFGSDPFSRFPINCTCAGTDVFVPSNISCFFSPGFEWMAGPTPRAPAPPPLNPYNWTCASFKNFFSATLGLYDVPLYRDVLGLAPGPDNYARFTAITNVVIPNASDLSPFSTVFTSYLNAYYGILEFEETTRTLKSGVVTSDYASYYASCAPSFCSYSTDEYPSLQTAATLTLGVVSGAQTVLVFLIGKLVDLLKGRWCPPPPDDEDEEGKAVPLADIKTESPLAAQRVVGGGHVSVTAITDFK